MADLIQFTPDRRTMTCNGGTEMALPGREGMFSIGCRGTFKPNYSTDVVKAFEQLVEWDMFCIFGGPRHHWYLNDKGEWQQIAHWFPNKRLALAAVRDEFRKPVAA